MSNDTSVWREKEWWALAALVVAFFIRPLTVSTFFFRDLHYLHFAKKVMLASALRAGELPLWDWLSHGGQPFLGNPQSGVFYPSNILYLVLSPLAAFNVSIVLQFLLCAFAAYWLSRVLGLSPIAAFVAGVAFTFCGYTLSTANLFLPLFGLPWLPLLVGCCERYFETRATRWIAFAAVCAAMPIFAGAPEIAILSYLTFAAWVGVADVSNRTKLRVLVTALTFAAGIALIQIIPTLEVIRESSRAKPMPYTVFAGWSVDPRRLPEIVVPQFFGNTGSLAESEYWGRAAEDQGFPYILSLYFGFPALLLAAYGSRHERLRRRALVLISLAVVGLLVALGRHFVLLPALYHLPGISLFRYPVKAIALAVMPVSLLAAAGVDRLDGRAPRWVQIVAAIVLVKCLAGAAILVWSERLRAFFLRMYFASPDPRPAMPLARACLQIAALLIVFLIAIRMVERRRSVALMLLAAVVAADLMLAGWPVNEYAPRSFFEESRNVSIVRKAVAGGRLYRAPMVKEFRLHAPSNDIVWFSRWNLEVLSEYTAILYGIPVVFNKDYDGLAPRRTVELGDAVRKLPWRQKIPLLSKAGCRAFVTADQLRSALAQPAAILENASNRQFFLYPVSSGGLAWFTPDIALTRFDDVQQLVDSAKNAAESTQCIEVPARVVRQTWNSLELDVNAPCDGFAYIAKSWYPGWIATVDGRETALERANYAFSAVRVARGRHQVRLVYRPASFTQGASGTALALAALAAWVLVARRRDQASFAARATSSNETTTSV